MPVAFRSFESAFGEWWVTVRCGFWDLGRTWIGRRFRVEVARNRLFSSLARRRMSMERCETCGNEYDKLMEVRLAGESHLFDSFECAIQLLAPTCGQCGLRIVGHGIESN